MNTIWILCVDDEPDVLRAVENEIEPLEDYFPIESAQSVEEAWKVINRINDQGDRIGLILCDQIMEGKNGVELLVEMQSVEKLKRTRKVLLTGQAGLEATIRAINESRLDHYLPKPWATKEVFEVAQEQLTEFIIRTGTDPKPYLSALLPRLLAESIHKLGLLSDE